jgi:hypothetical protein
MVGKVQIFRTDKPGVTPPTLLEGELGIEMAVPTRLWVGVPTALDPSGRKLLFDGSVVYLTQPQGDARYVNIDGDTMVGPNWLTLWADPALPMHAATKQYVDAMIGGIPPVTGYVRLTGDTMSGALINQVDLTSQGTLNVGGASVQTGITNNGFLQNNGAISATGFIRSTQGEVYADAIAGQNSTYFVRDENGANRGAFYWDRLVDTTVVGHATTPLDPIAMQSDGVVRLSRGMKCRPGMNSGAGNFGWNVTNFNFVTGMECWVDATNLGQISFVSDYRVKQDVVDLPGMWDTVKALRPIKYSYTNYGPKPQSRGDEEGPSLFTADGVERWGFIAHELQETLVPSAASAFKDAPNAIQSPNPWTIIAALTKTVQEMQTRIEALENKVP